VRSVDGRELRNWSGLWFALLSASMDGDDVAVTVETADGRQAVRTLSGSRLAALDPGRAFLAGVGLQSASPTIPAVIGELVASEPAQLAGLQAGDRVRAVGGQSIESWGAFVEAVRSRPGEQLRLDIDRDGQYLQLVLTPLTVDADGEQIGRIGAGPQVPDDLFDAYTVVAVYGPIEAIGEAVRRVGDLSILTLRIVGRMLVGTASVENLSSPIGIADAAGKTASSGILPYIEFLALLSVSLGLLNLLPIPVLDGGHLLFFAVEAVTRRPVPEAVQAQGQRIGLALILSLMTLAFYVDIARLLG
jgi:regulator of sigma E protease